jgi:hypothetical protein
MVSNTKRPAFVFGFGLRRRSWHESEARCMKMNNEPAPLSVMEAQTYGVEKASVSESAEQASLGDRRNNRHVSKLLGPTSRGVILPAPGLGSLAKCFGHSGDTRR